MIDRERTIRDLETIGAWHTHHYEPFHYECAETIHNALELLKEQEPVRPRWTHPEVGTNVLMCGGCGVAIPLGKPNYCPWCGRAVKWDET